MVRIGGEEGGGGEKPAWLQGLMGETFFGGCGVHHSRRKNEKNIFCLDCCLSFCPHCLPSHRSHPLLQVRRYVYHDVVRLVDLQKLIDCSFIQPYTINGAKVIFVKQRSQSSSRQWKGSSSPNVCFTCHRILQPPFHFCSLSCKVEHMVYRGEGMTWASSASQLEGLRVDNSDLLDDDDHMTSTRTAEAAGPSSYTSSPEQCEEEEEEDQGVVSGRSKKTSGGGGGGSSSSSSGSRRFLSVFSLGSRRKGAPHRAPLS